MSSLISTKKKNNVIKEINTKLSELNSSIKDVIDLRKSLNKAKPKSFVKTLYYKSENKKKNMDSQKEYDMTLSKNIKNIDNTKDRKN